MALKPRRSGQHPAPNYAALVSVVKGLRRLPDASLGETVPNRKDAARIRACGFEARGGQPWRCPLIPDDLVQGDPVLEPLAAGYDKFYRSRKWNPERAQPLNPALPSSFTKMEEAILLMLRRAPDRRLPKRTVQQRLWRLPAKFLNHIIQSLAARGYLQWQGSHIWASGLSRQL